MNRGDEGEDELDEGDGNSSSNLNSDDLGTEYKYL